MARLAQLRRVLIYFIVCAAALLLLGFAAIHIQQGILRHRAQQLLTDIRSINLRHTTYAEVQPILRRWRGNGFYDRPCTEERCNVKIVIPRMAFSEGAFASTVRNCFRHALVTAGGHPAVVVASISVRRGIVWGKSFSISLQVGPYHAPDTYSEQSYILFAEANSVSRFTFGRLFEQHADYQVGRPGGCEGCMAVWAKFTPYADPSDVSRLMQFNLDCITRWQPCRTQRDIMPAAWAQVEREQQLPYEPPNCTSKAAESAARDSDNAGVIQIVGIGKQQTENRNLVPVSALLLQRLKRAESWPVGTTKETWIVRDYVVHSRSRTNAVVAGTRWILLYDVNLGSVNPHECGIVPLTDANLAFVRRGIAQDYLVAEPQEH